MNVMVKLIKYLIV